MKTDPSKAVQPSCPRCGYDLSGQAAAWNHERSETCPLRGICSECGLEFEWRFVLNPRFMLQVRFFEVAHRRSLANLWLTARTASRPWVFWRWVAMEQRPNPRWMGPSMVLSALLLEVRMAVIAAALIGLLFLWDMYTASALYRGYAPDELVLPRVCFFFMPWGFGESSWTGGSGSAAFMFLGTLTLIGIPFTFVLLPTTLRRAKVIPSHLVRIGVWSFAALPMMAGAIGILGIIFWAAISAWQVFGGGTVFGATQDAAPTMLERAWTSVFERWHVILFVGLTGWAVLWWGFALGRYLKLPRPWLIAAAMFIISLLSSTLVCMFIPGVRDAIALRVS